MVTKLSNAIKSLHQWADRRTPNRVWEQTVESGKRLGRLTWWTFVGLLAVTVFVAAWGGHLVFQRIERTYVEMQSKTSADQARRIARLLEQELAAGVAPATVQQRLQESLSRSPYDDTGFLCLLDGDARVICHPDSRFIGMQVPFAAGATGPAIYADRAEWISGQEYAGDTHLVARQQVRGVPWQVSVHTNLRAMQQRVRLLRNEVAWASLPLLLGFVVLGTLAARVAGRHYERRIEEANRALESKVAERTAELAAAAHYHRAVIEAAPSAIFICDTAGTIRRANSQAAALTGSTAEAMRGTSVDKYWSWQGGTPRSIRPDSTTPTARDAKLRSPDGTERCLHVFTRVLDHGGRAEAMFVVQDVTELKILEKEFLQAQKMEAVGQLAGGIAHDFNNLLAAIMGFTELARLHSNEPKVHDRLAQSLAAGQRAARLSQQLLAFSRKQVLEPQVETLPALIDETRKVLERVLGEGIEIQTLHEAAPWDTRLDPTQFEQVLLNLTINARDAMGEQGRLVIRSRNAPAGAEVQGGTRCLTQDYVCLEVEDAGPGIPPEIQSRIFEPFFTTKPVGRGTGLGLASVQGIVQQHGGHIDLHSEVGRGTRFSLYFPRYHGPKGQAKTGSHEPFSSAGNGQRLLIVEDETALLESLCALLDASGYRSTGCSSRAEAVHHLQSGTRFDVILSDVVMPGQPLAEFLNQAQALAPSARIVLMSGYASGQALEMAMTAGIPLLRKPFSLAQLGAALAGAKAEPVFS